MSWADSWRRQYVQPYISLLLAEKIIEFRVAPSGMAWKGKSETVVAMGAGDLRWAQWLRVARGYQLRIGLANHKKQTFDGFSHQVRRTSRRADQTDALRRTAKKCRNC